MIYLQPSTAAQSVYLTLQEGRYALSDTFTEYLVVLTNEYTQEVFALIPTVDAEVERYTKLLIGTATSSPTTGNVLIPNTKAGNYFYVIYGQNSTTNIDPENAVVVGIVEQGRLIVQSTKDFEDVYSPTITSDTAYAG